jgi:TetR/AcrR family transcriptional repressor of lmrAB and yxaGH operons
MDNDVTRSRDDIVLALFELFRRAGYEGVSIGEISAATGLGRSSLYHHFPGGKADMAAAVVAFARAWMAEHLIAPLRSGSPLPERIDAMLAAARELYQDGAAPCLVASLLLNNSGEGPGNVGALLVDWLKALESALREAGLSQPEMRALDALIAIEGALILARASQNLAVFDGTLTRVRRDLIAG